VSNDQRALRTFVGCAGTMNGTFGMAKSRPCLFDKRPPSISELHYLSSPTKEKTEPVFSLDLVDLESQCWLCDMQSVSRTREVHFFSQNDYCMEMTHFDVGEHNSNPLELQRRFTLSAIFVLHQ
jgi:hypothetical protein